MAPRKHRKRVIGDYLILTIFFFFFKYSFEYSPRRRNDVVELQKLCGRLCISSVYYEFILNRQKRKNVIQLWLVSDEIIYSLFVSKRNIDVFYYKRYTLISRDLIPLKL